MTCSKPQSKSMSEAEQPLSSPSQLYPIKPAQDCKQALLPPPKLLLALHPRKTSFSPKSYPSAWCVFNIDEHRRSSFKTLSLTCMKEHLEIVKLYPSAFSFYALFLKTQELQFPYTAPRHSGPGGVDLLGGLGVHFRS